MTNNEANKIIADYMGCLVENTFVSSKETDENEMHYIGELYTESLDALVPVWEKLGRYAAIGKQEEQGFQATMLPCTVSNMSSVYNMQSVYEAAAHATAKAILALKAK